MKLTREAFQILFGVHLPDWAPYAMVKGIKYEFVQTLVEEVSALDLLMGDKDLVKR
ncbi:MAG: hypothetical protein ABR881_31825 [Candidatus Sulfotelmatobacter sp.]